jgi:anaerobic nitric oxide reductase flavorubredoxin
MSFKINDHITWVGKIDWELRKFHGEEYSTLRGSSYNSYLIRGEKTVLIDTVWAPFAKEFVQKLKNEIDLASIDYIVALHGEIDHSGSLPELMREIPGTPIYCSNNAVKSLRGHYHQDWDFHTVKTGDKLSLGSRELTFIEAPMLHWPDSMMAYLSGDSILFSNDAFGQHYASEKMYNDLVDQAELFQEATKYYANILNPFSRLVDKKIKEILALGLPVSMICPSHGIIWRDNPLQIVETYSKWAADYQENQVTVLYDTMWNGTRRMAESIAEGIIAADPTLTVKLFNIARSDNTSTIGEIFKSKGIVVGSPTVNKGMLSSVAALLEEVKGLAFKNKKASSFGAYGWSGEAPKMIGEELQKGGFTLVGEGHREMWYPDAAALANCVEFGRDFAEKLK